jgi:hypothetical protein
MPSRKWLAVVAAISKILPDVRRQLPERVTKLVEARIGKRQIPLRVKIVPLQNLVSTNVLPMFSVSVPKMPDGSGHESDGSTIYVPDVPLTIVAKVPRLPLNVVRSRTRHRLEKRSVAAAAYVPVIYTTDRPQPLHGRNPSPSRCRVVDLASTLPRCHATGSILDLIAVAIVVGNGVKELNAIGTAVD